MVDVAVMFGANQSAAERELLDSLNLEIQLAKVFFLNIVFSSSKYF